MEYHKLILITNRKGGTLADYIEFLKKCVTAGVTSIQLREKNATPSFLLEFGRALKVMLKSTKAQLIINDSIDLALALDADGVHLGQQDCDNFVYARKILGDGKIIGISVESEAQAITANQFPVDYIAASAVFETKTKSNINYYWGLDGLRQLKILSKHKIIAIGGINIDNVQTVIEAGADGVAVISAVHDNENYVEVVKTISKLII